VVAEQRQVVLGRLVRTVRRELGAVGELAGDRTTVVGPGDLVDLVGRHLGPEVGVGDLLPVVARREAHQGQQRHERAPEDPDGPSGHLLAAGT
jgi:hypothetical protein